MIKQVIDINGYWKVIVYYNVDYNFFKYIAEDLYYEVSTPLKKINDIYYTMRYEAKAVTVSSIYNHVSVVAFNKHIDKYDYLNSIVHEAEHVKQSMLKAYDVDDEGEPPAYTIGFIVMKMLQSKVIKNVSLNNT